MMGGGCAGMMGGGMGGGMMGAGGGAMMGGGGGGGAIQEFIQQNQLDDGASKALMSAGPDVQAQVMGRGPLTDCSNPSSAIIGRIREAKAGRGGGTAAAAAAGQMAGYGAVSNMAQMQMMGLMGQKASPYGF